MQESFLQHHGSPAACFKDDGVHRGWEKWLDGASVKVPRQFRCILKSMVGGNSGSVNGNCAPDELFFIAVTQKILLHLTTYILYQHPKQVSEVVVRSI